MQQGDLTDPYYFDFISFAQYAAMNREMLQNPAVVFEERKPVVNNNVPDNNNEPQQFTSVIVQRDVAMTNDMLVPSHRQLVGQSILEKLQETFGNTDARIPNLPPPKSRPNAGTTSHGRHNFFALLAYIHGSLFFFF